MAIGAGWAEGAWVDAGWVTGAWEQIFVESVPDATKGGDSLGKIKESKRRREEAQRQIAENKEELAELFPLGIKETVEELALKGKAEVGGVEISSPILTPPKSPISNRAPLLRDIKDKVEREIAKLVRVSEKQKHAESVLKHKRELQRFEEQFLVFIMLAMLD